MQQIMQAISSIGGATGGAGGLGNILKGLALGGGTGFDIFSDIKNVGQLNKLNSFLNNPAKAAAWINGATQPLSQGLRQNVGNATQGYLGERGLAESPAIAAEVQAQALAPYELQNQQQATQAFLAMLNPKQYPQVDLGSLFKLFKPTPSASAGGGTTPTTSLGDLFPSSQSDPNVGAFGDYVPSDTVNA